MRNVYTVTQVNSYIKNMFTQDFLLKRLCVKGEVSNCKYHSSGHIYFTLKDEKGALSCVMFKGKREKGLKFTLENGAQVKVTGSVDVYERDGSYQLYAESIETDGQGDLYIRYEQLKAELESRGMFSETYKRKLPPYIRTLGVVTAPTGAAVRDIISVSLRRNPHIRIILYPAIVQGDGASDSIVEGLKSLSHTDCDVIIAGRGGGSIEDLWAFNEEKVAQAIFDCPVPVISAVGHETDVTIADFVADKRAATPSAAAELAVFEYERFLQDIEDYRESLLGVMESLIEEKRKELERAQGRLKLLSPAGQIRSQRDRHARCEERLINAVRSSLDRNRHRLDVQIERLKGLNPLERISSGYAYVSKADGPPVRSVGDVSEGELLSITVRDGTIEARTERIDHA